MADARRAAAGLVSTADGGPAQPSDTGGADDAKDKASVTTGAVGEAAANVERPMRSIRASVKAKPKSGAAGSIKDGASLISAVASDLAMAKRVGFEQYLKTNMESTLSSSIRNVRPLHFTPAEARFNKELVQGPEGDDAISKKSISKVSTDALALYRTVVKKAKVLPAKCAIDFEVTPAACLAAAYEISSRIQVDVNGDGILEYPNSSKSNASIYGGWGGEGYTNTRDDRAVPAMRRWLSLGTVVPDGYKIVQCEALSSELTAKKLAGKEYVFTAAQADKFNLPGLKLTHCVSIDEPAVEYFHPAAQYTPAVKAEQDILVYHVSPKMMTGFLKAFPAVGAVLDEICLKLSKIGIPVCPPSRGGYPKELYKVGAFNVMFQGGPGAVWDKHQDTREFGTFRPLYSAVTQLSAGKSSVQIPHGGDIVGEIEYKGPGASVVMHSNMFHGTGSAELRTIKLAVFIRAIDGAADDDPISLLDDDDDNPPSEVKPEVKLEVKPEVKPEPAPIAGTEPSSLEPPAVH